MPGNSSPPPPSERDVDFDKLGKAILCFSETIYRNNGVWEGPDPLKPILPLFLPQIMIAILCSRIVNLALKPFNQPSFIAEIISGILLGPSGIGGIEEFRINVFPNQNFQIIETMAHFGLVLYAFMIGLQTDIKPIMLIAPKTKVVALAGIFIPFLIGTSVYFVLPHDEGKTGFVFCGATLTVTGFSTLLNILDQQRVLHTEVAKVALSTALVYDFSAWILLGIGIAVSATSQNLHWAILCNTAYLAFSFYQLRPILSWIIRRTPERQGYSDYYLCSLLIGMMFFGFITDAIGTHPMIGAFVFGLIMPSQVLKAALLNRLEDFVMGVLMPVFFVVCGLRTNIGIITTDSNIFLVILAIIFACASKIIACLCSTWLSGLSPQEAIVVGILTSTKSTLAMVFLEIAQVHQILTTQAYTVILVSVVVMTIVVTPLTKRYRPSQNMMPYKRRTIEKGKPNEELRVLACIYGTNDVAPVIQVLESSNSTQNSPIMVYGLQLIELVGRAHAPMLVVHDSAKRGMPKNLSYEEVQTSQIISAFDNYELRSQGVSTQIMTARSSFPNMAKDICNVAIEKCTAFIILPFHKQQTMEGVMEEINPAIQSVNEGVLINSPCSVGILIDRGRSYSNECAQNIVMLYFGGPDDREALSLGWRMAEQTEVHLTVIRFIPGKEISDMDPMGFSGYNKSFVSISIDIDKDKEHDEEFLNNFKTATLEQNSITYVELVLNDEEEAINAIKAMDARNYDLYLVGRGRGVVSPLTAGLADWCDCPELGPIGDLLVTSEFESAFSVLVIQQYMKSARADTEDSVQSSDRMTRMMDSKVEEIALRRSLSENESAFESFPSFNGRDHMQ